MAEEKLETKEEMKARIAKESVDELDVKPKAAKKATEE